VTSRRRKAAEGEHSCGAAQQHRTYATERGAGGAPLRAEAQAGPARLRLFVACDLPRVIERAVRTWQHEELAPHEDLRIAPTLHLTLAFLGSIDAAKVPDLERILSGIAFTGAECRFREPLFLPAHGKRRVVALELEDPAGRLRDLQRKVSGGLAAEGLYEPEKRPWLPHVTVARCRRPGHPFSLQNVNIGSFGVVRMVLYSSHLERAGAVHTPVADFPAS
jgi:RNA 2',3'-cyclic 3'-phosphodiesterase